MAQINLHVTPEFERVLRRYMRLRGCKSKSEALRTAVREGLERAVRTRDATDFVSWLGLARARPLNPKPRFRSDDDLWAAG